MGGILQVDSIINNNTSNLITQTNATTITIGASGQTITPAIGATILGAGLTTQSVQITGFTAVKGNLYPCNTTSAGFTVTLPASASVGDQIQIVDYAGTFATNNIILNPNGLKIESGTTNKSLTTNREAVTITYIDSTQGWVASSGVNSGTQALDPTTYSIDFLVIAGGGGGGGAYLGGGGGAGGFRTSTQSISPATVITVTVGGGGAGSGAGSGSAGTSGSSSSISGSGLTTITSAGGGGGSTNAPGASATSGGSGGGGCNDRPTAGSGNTPSTSPSQGNNGGAGNASYTGSAAGGGGAGAVGSDANNSNNGGNGGAGSASSITGSSVTYAGGGGAASYQATGGTGGSGGGGNGSAGQGSAGTTNTGGGGGGSDRTPSTYSGGAGGSGVIILSIPTARYSGTSTGSPTVTTSGSNTILKFTGSGTYTA